MTRGSNRVPSRSPKELINRVGSSVVYDVIVHEHASIERTKTDEVEYRRLATREIAVGVEARIAARELAVLDWRGTASRCARDSESSGRCDSTSAVLPYPSYNVCDTATRRR